MRIGKYTIISDPDSVIKRDRHKSRFNSILYYMMYPIMPGAWLGMIVAPVACFSMFFISVCILAGGCGLQDYKISPLTHIFFIAVGICSTFSSFICSRRLIYYLRQKIIVIEYVCYTVGIFLALLLWGVSAIVLLICEICG